MAMARLRRGLDARAKLYHAAQITRLIGDAHGFPAFLATYHSQCDDPEPRGDAATLPVFGDRRFGE
jgi:hypothetical protein